MAIAVGALGELAAQTCTAKAPAKVGINQNMQYTVTLNQNGSVSAQDFGTFKKVGGPAQSTSTSVSFSNGKQTSSYSITFTYTLKPTKTGKQTIPGVTCTVDGKSVKSNAVTVEVTQEDQQTQQQGRRNSSDPFDDFFSDPFFQPRQRQQKAAEPDVFIKAFPSSTTPYQGEIITITYKIYFSNVLQYSVNSCDLPRQAELWNYRIENVDGKVEVENVNGKRYNVATIYKTAVSPQKSGSLTVSPLSLDATLLVSNGFWGGSTVDKKVQSNPVTLNVKPLPGNAPDDFCGLVGQFTLSSKLSTTELRANDATELVLTLSGKGNLQLADNPEPAFASELDVADPSITENINTASGSISGTRTITYVIIPRKEGSYTIPAISLSYFDPQSRTYKTLTTEAYQLTVEPGDPSAKTTKVGQTGNDDSDGGTPKSLKEIVKKYLFIPLIIIILLILIILLVLLRKLLQKRNRRPKDSTEKRIRNANRIATKRLRKAYRLMTAGEDAAFYEEIAHALWDYIGHKFRIPLAGLSIEAVRNRLTEKGLAEEEIRQFTSTLDDCEFARFAPGDKTEMMNQMYGQAILFITQIEKK